MRRTAACLIFFLLLVQVSVPAVAQTEAVLEEKADLEQIRALRKQIEANTALDENLRTRILELHDGSISALGEAASDSSQATRHDRERTGVGRMVKALRAELNRPQPEPRLSLPKNATVEQAEGSLARERSRLAAYRSALRGVEKLAEQRAAARSDLSRRLGTLDQRIDALGDELRTVTQSDLHPDLKEATRLNLLAQREGARRKIDAHRAELALLDARGILIPGTNDQAQRRVTYSEQLVAMLEKTARDLQRRQAAEYLLRVRERCREAAEMAEELADIATETENYAVMLWGPKGVIIESERANDSLAATRKNISDLDRISQLTRRKFEAVGYRGSITRWWPDIPEGFPEPGDVASNLRRLKERGPEVQHRLIRFEQERAKSRALSDRILKDLADKVDEDGGTKLQNSGRRLFDTRRDLLDELIQRYGRYSNQLVELESVARFFLGEREAIQSFLWERALWVRSVPRPIFPRPGDTAAAFLWLVLPASVGEVIRTVSESVVEFPARGLAALVLLGALVGLRRRLRQRLEHLSERVDSPGRDTYWVTLEAFLHTLLLAAPLPLVLGLVSRILLHADASLYVFSAGRALHYLALTAGFLELSRQLFVPRGLAEAHFGWPDRLTRTLYEGLFWPEVIFLPLIYVALHLGMAGFRLTSPLELRLHNNSLGRIVFVSAMLILFFSLAHLFHPGKREGGSSTGRRSIGSKRLYMYIWPVNALATLVPAALATFGFYITGFLLAYQMLQTLWLAVGLLYFGGLLFRWHSANRSAALRRSKEADQTAAGLLGSPEMETQVRHLFRFVVILVGAVGLLTVWSEAIPALQIVKRIQLYPRIALLESAAAGVPSSGTIGVKPGEQALSEGTAEGEGGAKTALPGVPLPATAGSTRAVGTPPGSAPLTLWGLLKSILAIVITWVLVKNIPGLLELSLQRRTRLDSGARIAFSTLVRYMILIFGVSIAFSMLGISWSKIQWLVAALTFGLGFGLQEIVANFVSGLILLTERPVRVGDAVTIGNLMGQVTRIQMRATTVALWDRSEMVVPNKEFITSKLINWTLSDSKRRIDVPLRVAYGANLEKVKETLLETARQHPDVMEDPPPQALLLEFGDDAIKFELRIFVDFAIGLKTKDDLHMAIDRTFREHGIEFALPRLNIELPARRGRDTSTPPASGSGGSKG